MAGAKRASSSAKPQPDFKRLKAKVGKRAPKKAHETNTEFKATKLHVAGQVVERKAETITNASQLVSERGKSLFELSAQLSHPAAAARISALKGVANIATLLDEAMLRAHLSTILAAAAKGCVDEDDQVRIEGLNVLQNIISKHDKVIFKPFCSLLVAYASSALNSLDRSTRVDGTKLVQLLCSSMKEMIGPFAHKLLPPYSGLLSDRRAKKHIEEILESLSSLLKVARRRHRDVLDSKSHANMELDHNPDLIFARGGRNAVILSGHGFTRRVFPQIENMQDFETAFHSITRSEAQEASTTADGVAMKTTLALLTTLRDSLVESTEPDENTTVEPASLKVSKVMVFVKCFRLCWQLCPETEQGNDIAADHAGTVRVGHHVATMLLGMLPVAQDDVNASDHPLLDTLNALICNAVMDVATHRSIEMNDTYKLNWIDPLCSFALPRLEDVTSIDNSHAILSVIGGILLCETHDDEQSTDIAPIRVKILEELYKACFDPNNSDVTTMRHPASRKTVILLQEMIAKHDYLVHEGNKSLTSILRKIVMELPRFLQAWGANHQFESKLTLNLLQQIVRRIDDRDNKLLSSLRSNLGQILTVSSDGPKQLSSDRSVFEKYEESLQRMTVGLIVMIEAPTVSTISNLTEICARSNSRASAPIINPAMVNCISDGLHSIRTTLPMQSYLQFLVDSIGISRILRRASPVSKDAEQVSKVDLGYVVCADGGIESASRAFIQCGAHKTLTMIAPLLLSWLETAPRTKQEYCLQARAALAILTALGVDIQRTHPSQGLFELFPTLRRPSSMAICKLLTSIPDAPIDDKWCAPIISLLRLDLTILDDIFDLISTSDDSSAFSQLQVLEALSKAFVDTRMNHALTTPGNLVEAIGSLQRKLSGCSSQVTSTVDKMKVIIEMKCGLK